jgi:hypothetical protein
VIAAVSAITTTTTLAVTADLSTASMVMTAAIAPASTHADGFVEFFDDTTAVGSATVDSSGNAKLDTRATWTVGSHPISAVFHSSSPSHLDSLSDTVTKTVDPVMIPYFTGPSASPKVAVLGDSITDQSSAYIGAALRRSYATSITAVSGISVQGQQFAADKYALAKPSVLLVELGTNDAIHFVTNRQTVLGFKLDLARLTAKFPSSCVVVTTVTTHRPGTNTAIIAFDSAARQFNDYMHANDAHVVEWDAAVGAADAAGQPIVISDSVHPTLAGSQLLAQLDKAAVDGCFSSTTLTVSPNPVTYGRATTLTATVTGGGKVPTGTVQFFDGSKPVGAAVALVNGKATLSRTDVAFGSHSFKAVYKPAAGTYVASTSSAVAASVVARSSTTALNAGPAAPVVGQPVYLGAKVNVVGPAPVGLVRFYDGTTLLGTVAVNATGGAVLIRTNFKAGGHTFKAVFVPSNSSTTGSTSNTVSLTVRR